MVIFLIILVIVYLLVGFVRLSIELNRDRMDQVPMALQRKYLNYILIWPLPLFLNTIGIKMIKRAKRRSVEKKDTNAPKHFDENYNLFRKHFKEEEKTSIVLMLYFIATKAGQMPIKTEEINFIRGQAMLLGVPFDLKKYAQINENQQDTAEGIIIMLKEMSEGNKRFLCLSLHGLEHSSGMVNSFKQELTAAMLKRIGIDENKRQEIIKEADENAQRLGF